MSETLLILAFVSLLLASGFLLRRVKQPALAYIRMTLSVALLVLVWGFREEGQWLHKAFLTLIALYGLVDSFLAFRKYYARTGTNGEG